MAKNNAKMFDNNLTQQAGIDPKTKKPTRIVDGLKENIRQVMRIIDEQDAVNRYKWHNVPCDLTSQEIERLLYYKGQLCFFYYEDLKKFYFMPYALDGNIDFYGRFNHVHPVPMASGVEGQDVKEEDPQRKLLSTLKLHCVYKPLQEEEVTDETLTKSCVLLHDYTKQLSQTITPRKDLQEGILDVMSDIIPFLRTALLQATGVRGMRVPDSDANAEADKASVALYSAALNNKLWTPFTSPIEAQELTGSGVGKAEDYLLALQALDNYRLGAYGIENGGIFLKKAHVLKKEQINTSSGTQSVKVDGLMIRQFFCLVVNSIWDLDMWVDENTDLIPYYPAAEELMPQEQPEDPGEGDNNNV